MINHKRMYIIRYYNLNIQIRHFAEIFKGPSNLKYLSYAQKRWKFNILYIINIL